jgi:CheY-like chemotaxis protein
MPATALLKPLASSIVSEKSCNFRYNAMTLQILIIDDNSIDRMALSRSFKASNMDVALSEAVDGSSAYKCLLQQSFDCIFLDYRLPDTDGLSFFKLLTQEKVDIAAPVIMLTGEGNESLALEAIQSGIDGYLPKDTLTPESLKLTTESAIKKLAKRRESDETDLK